MGSRRAVKREKPLADGYQDVEMKVLPPSFFDIALEIDDHLKDITAKIGRLNALYRKNLLPGFNDRTADEEEIEQLNYHVTKTFQSCYVLVKKFEFLQHNARKLHYLRNEVQMLENLKKSYAGRIQGLLSNFRKLQNNYIKFLKEDDYEENTAPLLKRHEAQPPPPDAPDLLIEDYLRHALQQLQLTVHSTSEQLVLQREQEISKLAMGVLEVSSIFREMELLIIDQGTILDRIDYNLASAVEDLKGADKELVKGSLYQKRTQKCKIIFLLTLIVFALLMVVLVRPHTRTKVVERPSDADPPRPAPEKAPERYD